MLKKIVLFSLSFLTIDAKVINISSNANCSTYSHDSGKVEINCSGKIEIDDNKISQFGAKGRLTGQSIFLENETRFSQNNNFVLIPTFGDPTRGAGINGSNKDNLFEIIRVNIKTGEIKVIVRRKDKVSITNFFDFVPEQMSGISSGEVIPYNFGVTDDGKVIFYADIIANINGISSIVKKGYFISTNRDGEFYQINTFNRTLFNTPINPEILSKPTITKDGFYYTLNEGGIGKLMFYKGFERGKEIVEVANTSTNYGEEKVSLSTRIIQNGEKIYWGNIFPSLFTIDAEKNPIFTSRFFPFTTSVSDIYIENKNTIFATTRPFEQKDPWQNNSVFVVINGKAYKIISSGERVGSLTVGTISRNLHYSEGKVTFISDGNIVSKNVNIIENIKIKDEKIIISGSFPDLNVERGLRVLIGGVVVVPEGTIPSTLSANSKEISFKIPANASGKQKVDILFSTVNGSVGAVNNGFEFEFPDTPVELVLVGESHLKIAPGEITNINVNSNILGRFSVGAFDANGFRPVNIISSGNSRNINLNLKVFVNTKFIISFTSSSGKEASIEVFVEVLPPQILTVGSTREDGKFFAGDEIYISGENLSPDGEEHQGEVNNFSVKINNIDCKVNFVSSTFVIIQIPDLEITNEEENWITINIFGRETAYKIRIEKKVQIEEENRGEA